MHAHRPLCALPRGPETSRVANDNPPHFISLTSAIHCFQCSVYIRKNMYIFHSPRHGNNKYNIPYMLVVPQLVLSRITRELTNRTDSAYIRRGKTSSASKKKKSQRLRTNRHTAYSSHRVSYNPVPYNEKSVSASYTVPRLTRQTRDVVIAPPPGKKSHNAGAQTTLRPATWP